MKRMQYLCVLLAAGAAGAANAQNLVVNGSFETPSVANNSYNTFQTLSGWTLDTEIEIRRNRIGAASDGVNFAELDTDVANNGKGKNNTISQLITTIPGATYTFAFDYSNRPFESVSDPNPIAAASSGLHWTLGDASGDAPAQPKITNGANNWNTFTTSFVATGTSTLLSIAATGTVDSYGSSLDNISLVMTAVPEPESYAMLMAGLGAIAMVVRRRRRV